MRVLLTGASGFIGAAILARLKQDGHTVVAVTRGLDAAARRLPADAFVTLDISRAVRPRDWLPHIVAIDAVVNCAGVLQDSPRDSTRSVHLHGPAALYAACEAAGVRRVILISATGADAGSTPFMKTKFEGEAALRARELDWVILRPSVAVGRSAYGGSALIRGLAALPVLPMAEGWGRLQVVQLDDLTRTTAFFLAPSAPSRLTLDVVGPEQLTFIEIVTAHRRWLGYAAPLVVPTPRWLFDLAFRAGDALSRLGWRPPVRSTAKAELQRGAIGDPSASCELTGIQPQSLAEALAASPASIQDRWFARLYFLKPVGFFLFAAFWITTGLIALGPGWGAGVALIRKAGIPPAIAPLCAAFGALADIAIGIGIAFRRSARVALDAALAVSLGYLIIATALLPALWLDPLGPLVKIVPIVVLTLMLLAIRDER